MIDKKYLKIIFYLYSKDTNVSLIVSPPIAQLVERRTVEDSVVILRSLVRIRLGGQGYLLLVCVFVSGNIMPWRVCKIKIRKFDGLAEWLRREITNLLYFVRAGSSPAAVVYIVLEFTILYSDREFEFLYFALIAQLGER